MKWIGVVDCNNFFVSCERLFRPDLANKPVAVLSSNDGCVVARSQEVKDMGIPMGVPYFKVKDIVKDNRITLFSSHFALYRDISRRVFVTLNKHLGTVEQYSIDEAFFEVPDDEEPALVAERVKRDIETKIGIPVSVGIASSKTKAKYAVDLAKKTTGVHILTQTEWTKGAHAILLSTLWGVGVRSFRRYQSAGYETVADLLQADQRRIKTLFGISGERLLSELSDRAVYPVTQQLTEQQSIMSSRSFRDSTTDLLVLEDAVAYHTRHIAKDLRRQKLRTKIVRISIQASKYSDFLLQGASLEAVLDIPTNDTFTLLEATQELLRQAFKAGVPYKKVGVSASWLVSEAVRQETLFQIEQKQKTADLLSVVDALNSKASRELVSIGERYRGQQWQARKDNISPAYTTKWTDVVVVKA